MKKEEIYVTIDSEEKRLRAIEILEKVGEKIWSSSTLLRGDDIYKGFLLFREVYEGHAWVSNGDNLGRMEITIDQLEALLLPNYQVKTDNSVTLEHLKTLADSLGYVLVEKPYKPKVGDFGVFWNENEVQCICSFITSIDDTESPFETGNNFWYDHFRKLTEEEKQKIQESW